MSREKKPLVLDATVLSNFASSESISWLAGFSRLETWRRECDYYAPVESVAEALPDDTA